MTDTTEGLRLALEASEADIARLREENAALLERMVRAEKGERSARACLAVLLPDATLDALAKGKAIDDGGESPEDVLRARVAELNDALDLAAGDNAALRAQNAYLAPRQRAGQIIANALYVLDPEFYEAHRGTAIDPFNHDDRVVEYLRAWRESERDVMRSYVRSDDAYRGIERKLANAKSRDLEFTRKSQGKGMREACLAAWDAFVLAKQALTERIGRMP